jgi:hypothetical protein
MGRATPLLAAGAAAGWYLRRRGLLGGPPRALPPEAADPGAEAELQPHADAVAAVSDAEDVGAVVEDLLSAAPGEEEPGPAAGPSG